LSHDESVHGKGSLIGKMPGDVWQKFANLRVLFGYMYGLPGKKLLFMGSELAQWDEWNHDKSLDWHLLDEDGHQGIHTLVGSLNHLLRQEPALHELDFSHEGFSWLDTADHQNSVVSFFRHAKQPDENVLIVLNLTPVHRMNYR